MSFWNKRPDEKENNSSISPLSSTSSTTYEAKPVTEQRQVSVPAGSSSASNSADDTAKRKEGIDDLLVERFGKLRSALGTGTVIQGKLSFDTPVRIDGKLGGEIFSSKALIVGPSGVIEAKIEAQAVIIMGKVRGNVKAADRIELMAGGALEGEVHAPILVVQEGAILSGPCSIPGPREAVAQVPVQASTSASKSSTDAARPKATEDKKASATAAPSPEVSNSASEARLH